MRKPKGDVYICHTVYHLLISSIKAREFGVDSVCLVDTIPNVENFKNRVVRSGIFRTVEILKADDFVMQKYPDAFIEKHTGFFRKFRKVFIFNDDTYIGFYLYRQRIEYNLIEDGFNYYQHYSDEKKYQKWLQETHPDGDFPVVRGYNEMCLSVEANSLEGLPRDERFSKMKEVPRAELFASVSDGKRHRISIIFPSPSVSVDEGSVLVLAQPLFMDGIIGSKAKQIEAYGRLCEMLSKRYRVYFKPHPRDTVKFPKWNGVSFISAETPVEVLALNKGFQFDVGVTYSSTAMEFISCVKEKIIIFDTKKI